jgi:hypothetical protein
MMICRRLRKAECGLALATYMMCEPIRQTRDLPDLNNKQPDPLRKSQRTETIFGHARL